MSEDPHEGEGGGKDRLTTDAAVTLAEEALRIGKANTFLYVSAIDSFFVLPKRYIETKREAERRIAELAGGFDPHCSSSHAADAGTTRQKLRTVFLRPSFIYDSSRPITVPLAMATGAASMINGATGGRLRKLLGAAG